MSGHKCSKMETKEKQKILKRMEKAESLILKGQSDLSTLAEIVQPLFDQDISVVWSTDGARVTDDNGELGSFEEFLNAL